MSEGGDVDGGGGLEEVVMVEKRVGRERLRMRMRMLWWGRGKGGRRICLVFDDFLVYL